MRIDAKAMQFNEKLCEIEQMSKDLLATIFLKSFQHQENGSNGEMKTNGRETC